MFKILENRFKILENRFDILENRFNILENRFKILENRFKISNQSLLRENPEKSEIRTSVLLDSPVSDPS